MSSIWSGGKEFGVHSVISEARPFLRRGDRWKHEDSFFRLVDPICISFLVECCFLRRLTGKEKRVGGFDLMWNGGPVHRDDVIPATCGSSSFPSNTHLGKMKLLRGYLPDKGISRLASVSTEDLLFLTNGCKKSLLQDVWMTERHSFGVF